MPARMTGRDDKGAPRHPLAALRSVKQVDHNGAQYGRDSSLRRMAGSAADNGDIVRNHVKKGF